MLVIKGAKKILKNLILCTACLILLTLFIFPPEYSAPQIPHSDNTDNSDKLFVIIVAGFRTGSTFLGELFNQNSEAFYLFEPLHQRTLWANRNKLRGVNRSNKLLNNKDPELGPALRDMRIYYLEELINKCTVFDGSYFYINQTMKHAQVGFPNFLANISF